jgi:hypothetical protein
MAFIRSFDAGACGVGFKIWSTRTDINAPVSGAKMACVILKPINLVKVADLLSRNENELAEYIKNIIS